MLTDDERSQEAQTIVFGLLSVLLLRRHVV